jgi:hypothetical protein
MSHVDPLSFKVATTLAANRIVTALTGTANSVKYPAAALELPVGVTIDTVKDTTQAIDVAFAGIHKVLFNDTVASGALVASDSSGRGIPYVNATAGACFVGVLVGPAVAATGTIADVWINPGFKAIP